MSFLIELPVPEGASVRYPLREHCPGSGGQPDGGELRQIRDRKFSYVPAVTVGQPK
jgi:hypothetical protein